MKRRTTLTAALIVVATLAGCRSAHVEVTVENRTGGTVRQLEVDYPSASFGADTLAAGAAVHYRVQLQGSSAVKVQYTGTGNHPFQSQGPTLSEGQQGKLEIILEPSGKAEFHPEMK